jgi:hypothetical protein
MAPSAPGRPIVRVDLANLRRANPHGLEFRYFTSTSVPGARNFADFLRGPFGTLIPRGGQPLPKSPVRADDRSPHKNHLTVVSAGLLHRGGFTQSTYPSVSR